MAATSLVGVNEAGALTYYKLSFTRPHQSLLLFIGQFTSRCVNNAPPPPLYRQFMGVRGRGLIVYGGMSSLGAVGGLWSWSFATSERRFFPPLSRSMPMANAEDPCRSEGT